MFAVYPRHKVTNLEDFRHQRVIMLVLDLIRLLQFSGVRILTLITSSLPRYAAVLGLQQTTYTLSLFLLL